MLRDTIDVYSIPSKFWCHVDKDGFFTLNNKHNYYYQIQGMLGLLNLEWCDLVIWAPSIYSVQRIYLDSVFFGSLKDKLKDFYFDYYLKTVTLNT